MLYIPEVAKNCTTTAVTLVVRVVTLQLELLSISKGELDVNELSKMITHLQVIAPMEDLRALIAAVDVNLNGTIDCSELVGLIENTINETFSRWVKHHISS